MENKKSVIEIFKRKHFANNLEKTAWLESAIYEIEDDMIDTPFDSIEYRELLKSHSYLQMAIIKCSTDYVMLYPACDYKQ